MTIRKYAQQRHVGIYQVFEEAYRARFSSTPKHSEIQENVTRYLETGAMPQYLPYFLQEKEEENLWQYRAIPWYVEAG